MCVSIDMAVRCCGGTSMCDDHDPRRLGGKRVQGMHAAAGGEGGQVMAAPLLVIMSGKLNYGNEVIEYTSQQTE